MPAAELTLSDLAERLSPLGVRDVRRLSGGASSLTYAGVVEGSAPGQRRVVVKVAPPGVPPTLNRDMLRQARMIRALQPTSVPVPEVLWEDAGDPPDVPPLFVMAYVDGTAVEPLFDSDGDEEEAVVAERMRTAAAVLAALHDVAPASIGLDGEPVLAIGDEIDRWCRLLETVDPALAPGWSDVADALRAREVRDVAPAIVHGDFRLGNLLAAGPRITAVVDWEIWTVGDPRVDLGWFLANADPETYRRPTRYAGSMPAPQELAATYAQARGAEVPDLAVFTALACFKSTATWALIVKHNARRSQPDPELSAMADVLPHLLDRARDLLG